MEPISVTIKNNTNEDRMLRWLAKGSKWIGANACITVDYDPWSCADKKQREAMLSALSCKTVSFKLHVMLSDGSFTTLDYDPSALHSAVFRTAPAPVVVSAQVSRPEPKTDGSTHIVIAKGEGSAYAEALGLTPETPAPKVSEHRQESHLGFTKEAAVPAKGRVVVAKSTSDYVSSVEAEIKDGAIVEDKPVEPRYADGLVTSGGCKIDLDDDERVKYAFIEFVDNKQWQNALELLKAKFGEDKITFTTRAIMSNKDYDAIIAKYKLAE